MHEFNQEPRHNYRQIEFSPDWMDINGYLTGALALCEPGVMQVGHQLVPDRPVPIDEDWNERNGQKLSPRDELMHLLWQHTINSRYQHTPIFRIAPTKVEQEMLFPYRGYAGRIMVPAMAHIQRDQISVRALDKDWAPILSPVAQLAHLIPYCGEGGGLEWGLSQRFAMRFPLVGRKTYLSRVPYYRAQYIEHLHILLFAVDNVSLSDGRPVSERSYGRTAESFYQEFYLRTQLDLSASRSVSVGARRSYQPVEEADIEFYQNVVRMAEQVYNASAQPLYRDASKPIPSDHELSVKETLEVKDARDQEVIRLHQKFVAWFAKEARLETP